MSEVRYATANDERTLAALDRATWSPLNSPVPLWNEDVSFFDSGEPEDVIVAVQGDEIVGYVKLRRSLGLNSNNHVLTVAGLAVSPNSQRQGVGTALVARAIDEAKKRGARRLTLHVLGTNHSAIRIYESCGFELEGVLRDEFMLDGSFVDDLLMAIDLSQA
jgi:ribosomal protein S18 acetylase RimI-like enzyme